MSILIPPADCLPCCASPATCSPESNFNGACTLCAQGHCVRLAISGADAKHFHIDHKGPRTIWVHTGGDAHSCLRLPHARLLPE
jgi:hypothetical protein